MPRPRSPFGKHVTMSARVTEEQAAAVDKMRGTATRAEWIESLILAAIADPEPVTRRGRHAEPCASRVPPGAYCKACGHTHPKAGR